MTQIENGSGKEIAVGSAVRAFPGTSREIRGVVIEDFGDFSGHAVDVGEHHIVDAARRWAVRVYDDTLVFVDDDDITAD